MARLRTCLVLTISLLAAIFVTIPTAAEVNDVNLTGLIYLSDGTPLSSTLWANNTSFAIYVDHGNNWTSAWRYPAFPLWYTTSIGAYSIVLPAREKDVNWSGGDWYRVEVDASSILGKPSSFINASSHGTGDPGEFTPYGYQNNTIVWTPSDNWQRWDVILLEKPDLAVSDSEIRLSPSGPYVEGAFIVINATVRNIGGRDVSDIVVRFSDGRPPTGSPIGPDKVVASLPMGGLSQIETSWTANIAGPHTLCASADPDNAVDESDEGNNVGCVDMTVEPKPETRADYAPVQPYPASPVKAGLALPVQLSVNITNGGNASANASATLAFYNETPPASPFKTFDVPPLDVSQTSSRFAAMWISPGFPGTYRVVADVDYWNNVTEWNETDNIFTWIIEVVSGPVTSLVIGNPNYTSTVTYVKSSTPLDFSVLDQSGAGTRYTNYSIDGGAWTNYTATGTFFLSGEGERTIEWFSEDYAGNVENSSSIKLRVDDTPPATSVLLGDPKYLVGGNFANYSSSITLQSIDGGLTPVGLDRTEYRVDGGSWMIYSSPFFLTSEGSHTIDCRSHDLLRNTETVCSLQLIVDDTPPTTSIAFGEPKHQASDLFITSSTKINLTAVDGGSPRVGMAVIEYRVDGGIWNPYSFNFTIPGNDGAHAVEYKSKDLLGNEELLRSARIVLDNTPPITIVRIGNPRYLTGGVFVTAHTPIFLEAVDGGNGPVGVNVSLYRVWNHGWSTWSIYSSSFLLTGGDGTVYLERKSDDLLGNEESPVNVTFFVDDTAPATTSGTGTPKYQASDLYITSSTEINLTSIDGGVTPVGLDLVEYQIDGGGWLTYASNITLTGVDGLHTIEYRSRDLLGNQEVVRALTVFLDDTPPSTAIWPATGEFTNETRFNLTATDAGSGVGRIDYRIDGGSWIEYSGNFTLPAGQHNIHYRSVDNLGNVENEKSIQANIGGGLPPPSVEADYKPIVALVFAMVLAVVGLWSSRKRPWRGETGRRAVVKSFLVVSLPFVVAEAATGVASLLTGALSVPPALGFGTAVDLAILILGFATVALWLLRVKKEGVTEPSP